MKRLFFISVMLIIVNLPANAKFCRLGKIRVTGETFTVGTFDGAVRILDHKGHNVFPTYVYRRNGQDMGEFGINPSMKIAVIGKQKDVLLFWSPVYLPIDKGCPVNANWFSWNQSKRQFVWIKTDYSDKTLTKFSLKNVLATFSKRTHFRTALETAYLAFKLAQNKNWGKLAKLTGGKFTPNNVKAQLNPQNLCDFTWDWHTVSYKFTHIVVPIFGPNGRNIRIKIRLSTGYIERFD